MLDSSLGQLEVATLTEEAQLQETTQVTIQGLYQVDKAEEEIRLNMLQKLFMVVNSNNEKVFGK